jgi:C-terminal processing protease CtpA/Prc
MPRRIKSFVAAAVLLAASTGQAADKGYLGIAIAVDGEGAFWNPTLKSVKVAKVVPLSPAALAGIVQGDLIVEIEGKQVAGAKANDLKPYLERSVGQQLKLLVKSANGETRPVEVMAGPRPQ